jgi:hypothetical protein
MGIRAKKRPIWGRKELQEGIRAKARIQAGTGRSGVGAGKTKTEDG